MHARAHTMPVLQRLLALVPGCCHISLALSGGWGLLSGGCLCHPFPPQLPPRTAWPLPPAASSSLNSLNQLQLVASSTGCSLQQAAEGSSAFSSL
jgi:hypothetical protein